MLPGAWRLRLPLETVAGVPHVNAWALRAGDGIVLVDTGMHERGSMANLQRALERTGHAIDDVRLIVITHAHPDHCGQAAPIAEQVGCEVWIHPAYRDWLAQKPSLEERLESGRQSGVPEERSGAGRTSTPAIAAASPGRWPPTATSCPASSCGPTSAPGG